MPREGPINCPSWLLNTKISSPSSSVSSSSSSSYSSYSSSSSSSLSFDSDDDIEGSGSKSRRRDRRRDSRRTKSTSRKHTSTINWEYGISTSNDRLWPRDKRYLEVRFLNGGFAEKQLVESLIVKHYHVIPMHIRFRFLQYGDTRSADIRILFTYRGPSSSFIGRDSETVAADEPTMVLNMNRKSSDKIQAEVLHVFGHALGLIHEQQHADCQLTFNRSDLKKRYGYSDDDNRNYDIYSIMHFPALMGETMSFNTHIPLNTVLSEGDRQLLMSLYPARPEHGLRSSLFEPVHPPPVQRQTVYLSESEDKVVRGSSIVIHGSGNVVINGASDVVISGSGKVILHINGAVRKNGSEPLFVNNNRASETSGSGDVYANGSGTANLFGSGSGSFFRRAQEQFMERGGFGNIASFQRRNRGRNSGMTGFL
ncbi:hypothetical protein F5Y06DRAFT_296368 [Hypoxylon sp. FL0890]|nr:hypothetical protein F5Y06DRAFT_296368 [Hypoxylon sp. FL0890]